jgi:hypothetical protein
MQADRGSSVLLSLLLLLVGAACTGGGSDVLLSAGGVGDDVFTLRAQRDPLVLTLERPVTPADDDEVVDGYGESPSVEEAAAFAVVDEAQDITIVAGPVADDATRVVVRSGVSTSEASLVPIGDTTVFVARLVGHVEPDSIIAFDAEGAPVDITEDPSG